VKIKGNRQETFSPWSAADSPRAIAWPGRESSLWQSRDVSMPRKILQIQLEQLKEFPAFRLIRWSHAREQNKLGEHFQSVAVKLG